MAIDTKDPLKNPILRKIQIPPYPQQMDKKLWLDSAVCDEPNLPQYKWDDLIKDYSVSDAFLMVGCSRNVEKDTDEQDKLADAVIACFAARGLPLKMSYCAEGSDDYPATMVFKIPNSMVKIPPPANPPDWTTEVHYQQANESQISYDPSAYRSVMKDIYETAMRLQKPQAGQINERM